MQAISRLIRALIYLIIIYLAVFSIFLFYTFAASWLLFGLEYMNTNLGKFWFWVLFIFIAPPITFGIFEIIAFIAHILVKNTAKICPYPTFRYISALIISLIYCLAFLYRYWFLNGIPYTLLSILCGIFITSLSFGLVGIITKASYNSRL